MLCKYMPLKNSSSFQEVDEFSTNLPVTDLNTAPSGGMYPNLCRYKNILGKPGEGVHSYRIFNIAVVDVLLTVLLALIIYFFFPKISLVYILVFLFLLGIVSHHIFCVRTTVDKAIFGPKN